MKKKKKRSGGEIIPFAFNFLLDKRLSAWQGELLSRVQIPADTVALVSSQKYPCKGTEPPFLLAASIEQRGLSLFGSEPVNENENP